MAGFSPSIKKAVVGLRTIHTILVVVEERQPFALWCREIALVSKNISAPRQTGARQCYYLDSDGYLFTEAPQPKDGTLKEYAGGVAADNPEGAFFLDPKKFSRLSSFLGELEGLGLAPRRAFVNSDGDFEITLPGAAKILISGQRDFDATLQNLESFLGSGNVNIVIKEGTINVEYLDLRFGDKVFYRTRQASAAAH